MQTLGDTAHLHSFPQQKHPQKNNHERIHSAEKGTATSAATVLCGIAVALALLPPTRAASQPASCLCTHVHSTAPSTASGRSCSSALPKTMSCTEQTTSHSSLSVNTTCAVATRMACICIDVCDKQACAHSQVSSRPAAPSNSHEDISLPARHCCVHAAKSDPIILAVPCAKHTR